MSKRLLVLFFFIFCFKVIVVKGALKIFDENMVGRSIDLYSSRHEICHENSYDFKKKDNAEVSVFLGNALKNDGTGNCLKLTVILKTTLPIMSTPRAKICMDLQHNHSTTCKIDTNSKEYIAMNAFRNMLLSNTSEKLSCVAKNYKDVDENSATMIGSGMLKVTDNHIKAHTHRGGKRREKVSSGILEVIVCAADYENPGAAAATEKSTVEIELVQIHVLAVVFIFNQVLLMLFFLYLFRSAMT